MLSAFITPLLTFVAFLLLLLVSLSVPIIKSIFLLSFSLNINSGPLNSSANYFISFGVWGYCVSTIQLSALGLSVNSGGGECVRLHFGHNFDQTVVKALGDDELKIFIWRALTAALVLHPMACGFAFLALFTSLGMIHCTPNGASRLFSIITLGAGLLAALITTIIFFIDIALVVIVRNKLNDSLKNFNSITSANISANEVDFNWGNAVWMTLGATIALWAGEVGACAGIYVWARNRKQRQTYEDT